MDAKLIHQTIEVALSIYFYKLAKHKSCQVKVGKLLKQTIEGVFLAFSF
jgi:hypothetical protein